MELPGISEKKPAKNTRKGLIIAAIAVVAILAVFLAMKQGRETNDRIERVISDLQERAGAYRLSFPVIGEPDDYDDIYWGAGGYFEQVKDKKKFVDALAEAMETVCVYAGEEGEEKKFHSGGFQKACRMAAVLEYMDYENADIKAVMDNLMVQAAEAAKGDNWITSTNLFKTFAQFGSLPYYGSEETLTKAEIEAVFAERWEKIKREMPSGEADLDGFFENAVEVASIAPLAIPEYGTVKGMAAAEAAAEGVAPSVQTMYLDMDKMAPYDEVIAALEEYGEEAIFRNGEGGYYDGSRGKGTLYGDFRSVYSSGKVRRTGNEDEFTEQYLREHYDKPSSTSYYFRDKRVSSLPPFYIDTEKVFVYDGNVYAIMPYAVYVGRDMVVYDAEAAGQRHISLSEAEMLRSDMEERLRPYLRQLSDFAPRYEYDIENDLVTVYLKAPEGTTEALKGDGQIPIKEDTKMAWESLREYLCDVCEDMYDSMWDTMTTSETGIQTGVGLILASDVDPESGLLSILNGEVVEDHSKNPPAPAKAEEPETEPAPEN